VREGEGGGEPRRAAAMEARRGGRRRREARARPCSPLLATKDQDRRDRRRGGRNGGRRGDALLAMELEVPRAHRGRKEERRRVREEGGGPAPPPRPARALEHRRRGRWACEWELRRRGQRDRREGAGRGKKG